MLRASMGAQIKELSGRFGGLPFQLQDSSPKSPPATSGVGLQSKA
jgi:hypothetical protein